MLQVRNHIGCLVLLSDALVTMLKHQTIWYKVGFQAHHMV